MDIKEYKHRHYLKNKEAYINRAKVQYKKDPQKVKDRVKKWNRDNPNRKRELSRIAMRKYYAKAKNDPKKLAEIRRRGRITGNNYLARKKKAVGKFTKADIEKLYIEQRGKCFYCGEVLNSKFDIEHKIPLKHGGTNWPENLALACRPCNTRKGTKSVQQFQRLLKGE